MAFCMTVKSIKALIFCDNWCSERTKNRKSFSGGLPSVSRVRKGYAGMRFLIPAVRCWSDIDLFSSILIDFMAI